MARRNRVEVVVADEVISINTSSASSAEPSHTASIPGLAPSNWIRSGGCRSGTRPSLRAWPAMMICGA